jgi:hypothetical protein
MSQICNYPECTEKAYYGMNRNSPQRCKTHKDNFKAVWNLCICGRAQPSYNEPNENKPICCKDCKTDDMINVKKIKYLCKCGKALPSFNTSDKIKPICCKDCKTEEMVNIVNKKCRCGKKSQPLFNEPNQIIPICCNDCKTHTMVNIRDKKCRCGKAQPRFNEPNEKKPICCKDCKTPTMVNVKDKKCKCGKAQPYFNEPNEKKPICCKDCKTPTMVNIKDKKCPGIIIDSIPCPFQALANCKFKDYCAECFRKNFPLDPQTFEIKTKVKEYKVRNFINSQFEGFQHDKPLETGHCDCTIRRRIDHRNLFGNTLLVVETDENQHKSYDIMNEEMRYDDLYMAFSGKWIYIRFNPDSYNSKDGKRRNPSMAVRLEVLQNEMKKQIKRIEREENTELIERIYLYYDGYD